MAEMVAGLPMFQTYLSTICGLASLTVKQYMAIVTEWKASDQDAEAWILGKGGAPSTVTSRLAAIRRYARFAKIPDPTAELPRPKARKGIPRPVPDVVAKIVALDLDAKLAAIFLLETGMRISEAYSINLRWQPIPSDLMITGKGGKDRLVPLTERAVAAMTALNGRMPRSKRWLQQRFSQQGFTPHQLRHTLGCQLGASGADLGEIQDLLGHSSPATTRGYTSYSLTRLRGAQERRESQVMGVGV